MADTLAQFRTRIRRFLREMNPETSFWTEPFLNQMFNACYRRRSSQLVMAYEGWFVQVATRDIEADKSTYGFPDGVQRLEKIEIVRSGGTLVPLQRNQRHEAANPENSSVGGDGYLPNYRLIGNGFVLEPTPIEDDSDALRIEYAGLPTLLSSDGDRLNPAFPEIFDELLVLDSVIAALDAEGIHESGPAAAILRFRAEWEFDWERFIDQRTISRDRIEPFIGPYSDA